MPKFGHTKQTRKASSFQKTKQARGAKFSPKAKTLSSMFSGLDNRLKSVPKAKQARGAKFQPKGRLGATIKRAKLRNKPGRRR